MPRDYSREGSYPRQDDRTTVHHLLTCASCLVTMTALFSSCHQLHPGPSTASAYTVTVWHTPTSHHLVVCCAEPRLVPVLDGLIALRVDHTLDCDVAEGVCTVEGHLDGVEHVWVARRHHKLQAAAAVCVIDEVDAPDQRAASAVIPPVTISLQHKARSSSPCTSRWESVCVNQPGQHIQPSSHITLKYTWHTVEQGAWGGGAGARQGKRSKVGSSIKYTSA